jgi:hypothetical protein
MKIFLLPETIVNKCLTVIFQIVNEHNSWQFQLAVFHYVYALCISGLSLLGLVFPVLLSVIIMELILDVQGNIAFTIGRENVNMRERFISKKKCLCT